MAEKHTSPTTTSPTRSSDIETPLSAINEKTLLRKLDLRLLPAVSILYLLSFLDRSNGNKQLLHNPLLQLLYTSILHPLLTSCFLVANARLEGLTTDLGMTSNQYLTGLTLYFIGYVLFELPCNIVLKRTSPKFWLPTLTIVWGVVATLMGVTRNLAGFFVARFA
jgi:hypothetical protein